MTTSGVETPYHFVDYCPKSKGKFDFTKCKDKHKYTYTKHKPTNYINNAEA
jgi:hypothetical protein